MDWVCWLFLLGGLAVGFWLGYKTMGYFLKLAAKKIEFDDGDVWKREFGEARKKK